MNSLQQNSSCTTWRLWRSNAFKQVMVAIALCAIPVGSLAETIEGRVVHVQDGDTLTIESSDKHRHVIRLAEIDAPEKGQPFGKESKTIMEGLTKGKEATADVFYKDRYGRSVAAVVTDDGINLNEELVRRGGAWAYTAYLHKYSAMPQLESAARNDSKGLWNLAKHLQVPPWIWRRQQAQ